MGAGAARRRAELLEREAAGAKARLEVLQGERVEHVAAIGALRTQVADLERAGFKLGKIFYRQNEDLIPYTVLDQSIAAETVLEKPSSIDLTISVLDMQDIFNQMIDK